jgi:transposase-like protein
MSTCNQQSSSKERFWRRMVRRCSRSGLSVRAFCAEQGLSEPSFYAWRRTLAVRDEAAVRFVPVQVTSQPQPTTTEEGSLGALELVLRSGRRLRIGPGFDGPTLARLLALLEEGRP